jgi:hypothetical protein
MTQFILLGIVAIAILVIAPLVGASTTVKVDPNQTSSPLLARTIFDLAEEGDINGEDIIDRRDELREDGKLEERRDDARRWAERNDD